MLMTLLKGSFLICLVLVTSCASTQVVKKPIDVYVPSSTKIILAPPLIDYVDATTAKTLDFPEEDIDRTKNTLIATILECFSHKGIVIHELKDPSDLWIGQDNSIQKLYALTKMDSTKLSDSDRKILVNLCTAMNCTDLFFMRCRFYVGPGGYWDPIFSGAIGSDTSRVVFDAHLFSIKGNNCTWKQSTQVRTSPDSGSEALKEAVAGLLSTLKTN